MYVTILTSRSTFDIAVPAGHAFGVHTDLIRFFLRLRASKVSSKDAETTTVLRHDLSILYVAARIQDIAGQSRPGTC